MSSAHILAQARRLVPPLLDKFHKGQLGRVLVVGGSEDYTGAPYFSCMAAAHVGSDMSHILCSEGAGIVIKGYSPNLMVHPYLKEGLGNTETGLDDKIVSLLDRIHVVVVGPGMGRDQTMISQVTALIEEVKRRKLPLVIDADGLFLAQHNLDLVKDTKAILTPNVAEFARLTRAQGIEGSDTQNQARDLANALGVTLLVKGNVDIITDGRTLVLSDREGSPRRVSGQGDTLSGCLATFLDWAKSYEDKLWDVQPVEADLGILAAYAASSVTRLAARKAFDKKGRSMSTTDVTEHVGEAFSTLFET